MTQMTVLEALNAAMVHELQRDPLVVVLGEDVGTQGGIFRTTEGLQERFGVNRVIDTPLDEKGIAAHAIGMALYGLRPIVEIQFSGFIHDAFEQFMFCASKYRWLTGGMYSVPLVVRAPSFGGIRGGFWHSQSPESYFIHGGGMKVIAPATPQDAYSMLLAAIRDPDPVLVLEPVPLYRSLRGEVLDDGVAAELGVAEVVREGRDLTLVTWGPLRHDCMRVAQTLAEQNGYDIEVIDLRSLVPYDEACIVNSVMKTGRLVIAHEAATSGGFGGELAAVVQQKAFGFLRCPIERVAPPDLPYGYAGADQFYRPNARRITAAVVRTMEFLV
jgi:pyruvate/2-oxoglutarate/acetoin dehydrogenase E1 component